MPAAAGPPWLALCRERSAVLPRCAMIDEFDEELRELKREIIESRGLIIKTNNLTNALSADLKSIAKRQQGYERRLVWNSATAYVVFVRRRLRRAEARLGRARRRGSGGDRADASSGRPALARAQRRPEARRGPRQGRGARSELSTSSCGRASALKWSSSSTSLNKEPLTKTELAVFTDAVERARGELSIAAYHQGLDHARVGPLARGGAIARRGAALQGRRVAQPARPLQPRRRLPPPGSPARRDPDADPAFRSLAGQRSHGRRDLSCSRNASSTSRPGTTPRTRCAASSAASRTAPISTRSACTSPRSVSTTRPVHVPVPVPVPGSVIT